MTQANLSYELDIAGESIWRTVSPSPAARASLAYVQELGDFQAGADYYTKREGLDSYLIKYVLSGEGELFYEGQRYVLSAGQGFWIDCHKAQYYRTAPGADSWRVLWVHFYGGASRAYYEMFLGLNGGLNAVTLPPRNDTESILHGLIHTYRSAQTNLAADIRASGLLNELMVQFTLAATGMPGNSGMPECVRDARAYLLENHAAHITLEYLARRYSMNKYYFLKLFKRHTGLTPNEYLIVTRLNRAKELLRTTDCSIAQISTEVGIENPSHFINLFRQREGLTPGQFRQNWYGLSRQR